MDRDALRAAMAATAATAATPRAVEVPGWPTVYVRVLTAAEVDENAEADNTSTDKRRLARGAARVLCDETGTRLFDANSDADVTLIASQPWPLLQRVVAKANEVNGAGVEGEVAAGKG
jgi:hypothetical protein